MSSIGLVSALVPSAFLLAYFRSRDLNPEPARVVWATFFLGVATVVPVLAIVIPLGKLIDYPENVVLRGLIEATLEAAIPEELFKFLVLTGYAARRPEFDEPMDGIVYGAVASLGFATLENLMYVSSGGTGVAVARALTAVPGHAFLGAIMGYYVGQARMRPTERKRLLGTGYLWAALLHALYDWPVLTLKAAEKAKLGLSGKVAALLALATLLVLAVEARWALGLSRKLRRDQKLVAALQADRSLRLPLLGEPVSFGRRLGGSLLALGGCAVAVVGGLVLLGSIQTLFGGQPSAGQGSTIAAAVLFGLGPVVGGVVLFRTAVRMLRPRALAQVLAVPREPR